MDDELKDKFYIRYAYKETDVLITPAKGVTEGDYYRIISRVDNTVLNEETIERVEDEDPIEKDVLWVEDYSKAFDNADEFDKFYRALKSRLRG